jgi:hypothetical protein
MGLEHEPAHTPAPIESQDSDVRGGAPGGGHAAVPPPPSDDGGTFLADARPTPDALAERAHVMEHWSEDLLKPPVDVHALIGDLESKLTVDPSDKGKSLEALDQAAAAKKVEAEQKITAHEAKFDEHEAKAKDEVKAETHKQVRGLKEGHKDDEVAGAKAKPALEVCAPVTKDNLKQRVTDTMTHELEELDKDYEKEKTSLDTRLGKQLDDLDDEKKKQEGKVGDRATKGQTELKDDIAKRAGKHADEIAKEQKTIDAEAVTQDKKITDQGGADKTRADAEQKKQAELNKAQADAKAAEIRAKASAESSNALTSASARGKQFTDAANARAAQVPEKERAGVIEEGKQRNTMALLEGQKRQQEILAKGETDAKAAIEEGKKASETMAKGAKSGAKTYADQIGDSTKAGTDRVDGAAKKANQDMKAVSAQAVTNMQAGVDEAKTKSGETAGKANASIEAAQGDAKGFADKEKTAALAKLKEAYEANKAKIQAKGKAELEKIDKSKEKDLCKLEKQVSGDLKTMQHMAQQADAQMAGQVKLAERKVQAEVQKKKVAMRLAAQQAIAAISGFVAKARQAIKAADKNTLKDIHAQAKLGHQGVVDMGKQALADVTKNNDAIVQKVGTDGAADRASIDAHAKASEEAMAKTAAETKGAVDEQVLQETLAVTGKTIQKKPWYDYTSDKQANQALDALTSLPKDLQGQAVAKLPDDQFKNLVSEVPEKRREDFESLVENTTDPDRKLKLWAGYAKSKAHNDADRLESSDTGHWWSRSKEQKENQRKNDVRHKIADTTDKEVDEEVAHLRELEKNGTPLTAAAVDELYQRKKYEDELEMKYNINLTNETGNTNAKSGASASKSLLPQDRAVWSKDELQEVEKGLARLPAEATKDNDHLKEIRRRGGDYDWDASTNQWTDSGVRAWHTPAGEIIVNDNAALNPHSTHFRMFDTAGNPIHSDLAGDPTRPGYDHAVPYDTASNISGTLNHEIGHDIAQKHPEILAKIQTASDWQQGATRTDAAGVAHNQEQELRAFLASKGLSAADVNARIARMKKSSYQYENFGGRQYNYNDYTGKVESFAEGQIAPEKGKMGNNDYMRTDPGEQFAEMYSRMANVPVQMHQDMVDDPAKKTTDAQAALTAAKQAAAANPADATLAQKVTDAQNALTTAQGNQAALQTQWTTMRNDAFHTNDAETKASDDLKAHAGGTPNAKQQAILTDFTARAAECGTPDQIEVLKKDYQARLDAAK